MQWVLPFVTDLDASGESLVAAVSAFEHATGGEEPLEALLELASRLTGAATGCLDQLNGREVRSPGGTAADGVDGLRPSELPPDRSVEVDHRLLRRVDRRGRAVGLVWLDGARGKGWTTLHDAVLDRLAFAVALEAARVHAAEQAELRLDPAAVEALVAGGLAAEQAAYLAKRVGLSEQSEYVVVAGRARQELDPAVLADVLRRCLATGGAVTRSFVVGTAGGVVIDAAAPVTELLAAPSAIEALERCGAVLGIGRPALPRQLFRSWRQARGAMALAPLTGAAPVLRFDDLGALALLGEIPATSVESTPDVQVLRSLLDFPAGAEDLRLLEAFCTTGGLRATAAVMHMHHSSVRYRIDRLQRELGFPLEDGAGMLRALLAVKLLKMRLVAEEEATAWRTTGASTPTSSG